MRYVKCSLVDVIGEECLRIELHDPLRTLYCTEEMYRRHLNAVVIKEI